MMKIETLTNIVNNLWQDEDINGIVLRIKWEDITCAMVLDCREIVILDADEVECAINNAITDMLLKIAAEAENRFLSLPGTGPIELGPVKYVRISKSYLDPKIMELYATLEGGLVPQFKEEENG